MPLYMDIHRDVTDATPADIERAHLGDVEVQERLGVRYLRYWFNQDAGTVFCLIDAPNREAAVEVHRRSHGLLPDQIIEVESAAVDSFLGTSATAVGAGVHPQGGLDGAFRAILLTELDYASIAQRASQAAALDALRAHDRIVRDALNAHGGREVKHTGDGILASVTQLADTLECARSIQRRAVESEPALDVSIGVSCGEPVERDGDLFGVAVQLARRLCECAEPGRILVSNAVRELSPGKVRRFEPLPNARLKGFDEPVRLHEFRWRDGTPGATASPELERRLAAIVSLDVVGYSRLMARDEVDTLRALLDCRELVRRVVGSHGGRVVDAPGDNLLAEHSSALDAARCAVAIQREVPDLRSAEPAERRLRLRIGVHLGDVVVEGPRIYGDGVNVAARLEALAEPGGICLSGTVHDLVSGKLEDVLLQDLGELELKNFPRPVRVHRGTLSRPSA